MTGRLFVDLLEDAAHAAPELVAVISPSQATTYAALAERARRVAGALGASGERRFAVVHDDAATVLALLVGASAVGAEACLYPSEATEAELVDLARRFEHRTVVTDRVDELPGLRVVRSEALVDGPPTGSDQPRPADATVLVLTTGTTGQRKGARHDWRRLTAAVEGRAPTPGARWLVGYDLHQFAGLQLLLHVVATGSTFVEKPVRPIDAPSVMCAHGVTHLSATPTYWRFLLAGMERAGIRPELEQITLGGEAVPPRLLDDLERAFPEARISQVYASTELGSSVSVRDRRAGLPVSVLDRPESAPVRFRIDDGELWATSRVGMVGYHGEPVDPDAWRPTGDLVEIRDGRIRFVGRTSDRINVGGVKVHPLPVEEVVATVPDVAHVRVYGRDNPLTGQIVAVDVVAEPGADPDALTAEIRRACESLPRAARPRLVNVVDQLETLGHKVVRSTRQRR